eukprot:2305738-Pleurochrysis_carterae.AAC.1
MLSHPRSLSLYSLAFGPSAASNALERRSIPARRLAWIDSGAPSTPKKSFSLYLCTRGRRHT